MKKNLAAIILFTISVSCLADVKLPAVIGDNMVVQQKSQAAIWGWADPGEKVTVKGSWDWLWGKSAVADDNGKWLVRISTPAAGGPYCITIKGRNEITINNVLSGEVWLCSGQSNMSMPVAGWDKQPIVGSEEEIKTADYPNIRLFQVPTKKEPGDPQYDCDSEWKICSPETVGKFSAVGYFFGKELYKNLDIPIGLIDSSHGASSAEAWMPRHSLESNPEFVPILERWDREQPRLKQIRDELNYKIGLWKKEYEQAKKAGKPLPPKPRAPWQLQFHQMPTRLYNTMRLPIQPYTIKGMIWYQGETNVGQAYQYRKLFPALIENWRSEWGQGDFPFYYVQLAGFHVHQPGQKVVLEKGEPKDSMWAELRESQVESLCVPNTGMAVACDLSEVNCIHPGRKVEVGQRLAAWALVKDYGKEIPYASPLYKEACVEGDKIRISFCNADNGLTAKGSEIEGFSIAGADQKFVWANAKIDGNTIVVSSPEIKEPVAIRYAWADYPFCNLYNKEGFPVSPFRTDDWKLQTQH